MTKSPVDLRPALSLVLALLACSAGGAERSASFLPSVEPEAVGFSSSRLERLDRAIERTISEKQFAGVCVLAARHGKVFLRKHYGAADLAKSTPITDDTIFRIYSMSKPITGAAMMILYEEGKWSAQDPIAKYIPEFAGLKVYQGLDPQGHIIVQNPAHAPLMRELMTNTAGFGYGNTEEPADRLYRDAQGHNAILEAPTLYEMIRRLARIPLLYQPGQRWFYSASTDVQGYLIEKLSGQTFPDFVRRRIFEPLGMKDSAFFVPKAKRARFAVYYQRDARGGLDLVPGGDVGPDAFDAPPSRPSGGGGMVSTGPDYLRFEQMLLNGGTLNGVRILGPETVRLMTRNHLPERLMIGEIPAWIHCVRPGFGFGFDLGVFVDPALADEVVGRGTYLWGGAAGTWFWVDPERDIAFVGMVQKQLTLNDHVNLEELTHQTLYQALVRPEL